MSGSVMFSSHKESWMNGDMGLSLGSCYLVAVEENATLLVTNQKPEGNCATIVEAQEYSTSGKASQHIPPSAIRQILTHSSNINGSSAEEGYNDKACGKPLSSQYKGVVSQPNGRWGAQIYEKHRRVWLGTFNNEEDAARSYDTAAIKFRGHKATTNFFPGGDTRKEAIFLGRHSKAEIVDMLRTHTYHEELHHSYKTNAVECSNHDGANESPREHLFEKALTPSDVGKLNRLVVPKHHAMRCLPLEPHSMQKGVVLNCEDAAGKTWRFRYSYWSSSQSYVFTKGWSRYSKSNRLQSGDILCLGRSTGSCRQLYIGFRRRVFNQVLHQPAAIGSSSAQPILVRLIPDSYSPPAVPNRPTTKGLIPCLNSSSAIGLHSLSPSMKSPSKKGNSCPVEYPQRKKVTTFSSTVSNVKVFGVNLSL